MISLDGPWLTLLFPGPDYPSTPAVVSPFLDTLRLIRDAGFMTGTLLICLVAWRRGSLSRIGALLAFLLALILFCSGGIGFIMLLLVFFASSTLLTRLRHTEKAVIERDLHARTGPRDTIQVLANGGPALIMALLYAGTGQIRFTVALAGALAACNADTWASEIGMLSKKTPFSLLTGQPVQRGLSGGVTWLGILASLGGATLVALTFFLLPTGSRTPETRLAQAGLVWLAGIMGSLIDSLLGATLQAQYIKPDTALLTEKSHEKNQANRLCRGLAWMTNDLVNFISALLAASLLLLVLPAG